MRLAKGSAHRRRAFGCLGMVWVAGFGGCGGDAPPMSGPPASLEVLSDAPRALATVPASPVVGRTGPGGAGFSVAHRTPAIEQYPCASCHAGGSALTPARETDVHGDIRPVHPADAGPACTTCHAESDPSTLQLLDGRTATLDQAYRLCAGCHFEQGRDWAGGAHGKRLAGWRGQRVVLSCTGCHDPHSPTVDTLIPFRGPRIPRTGGGLP